MICGEFIADGELLEVSCPCGHLVMVHKRDGSCDLCAVRAASDQLAGRLQDIVEFNELWDGS